jgi:hypothetical protein
MNQTTEQQEIGILYDRYHIPDTLNEKGEIVIEVSPLLVRLGQAIHMCYFNRQNCHIRIAGLEEILLEFLNQPYYYYQEHPLGPAFQVFV